MYPGKPFVGKSKQCNTVNSSVNNAICAILRRAAGKHAASRFALHSAS
jgi:hypothetical protein